MGTRGLTAVIKDGVHRVAQYGQWDHYPTGQGTTVLEFCCRQLNTPEGRERFITAVDQCRFLTVDEHEQLGKTVESDAEFLQRYPQLSRNCGAEILGLVLNGTTGLHDSSDFARDSLFCEYGYVVDLDESVMEVHQGFQEAPHLRGRYCTLVPDGDYYPIRLVAEFDLNCLPPVAAASAVMAQLERLLVLDKYPEDCADDEDYRDVPSIVGKMPREVTRLAIDSLQETKVVPEPEAKPAVSVRHDEA